MSLLGIQGEDSVPSKVRQVPTVQGGRVMLCYHTSVSEINQWISN